MACSSPLYGYRMKKVDKSTGEIIHVRYDENGDHGFADKKYFIDDRFQFISSKRVPDEAERLAAWQRIKNTSYYEAALIPCGRCLECRLEYSRQWANRCMLEASCHTDNYFITLTYDDEHLPKNDKGLPTLDHNAISVFMKNLRRYFDHHYKHQGIRFFGCGEYGDTTGRPHYHIIIFNLPINDLQMLFHKKDRYYFNSPSISSIWDKGFAVIGSVDWDICAYVARYVVKKQKGEGSVIYKELDIEPEYVRMSRDPGIGKEYYDSHKDIIYRYDKVTIPNVGPIRPSKYYDKLFDLEDPSRLFELKQKRIAVAESRDFLELCNTDLSPLEYCKVKHDLLVRKIESLKRDEI